MRKSREGDGPTSVLFGCTLVFFLLVGCGDGAAPDAAQAGGVAGTADAPRSAAQDPDAFAPKAEISPEADEAAARMARMFLDAAVVPRRDAVGIPPYPGARVVQVQPASPMMINDEEFEALPVIVLISDDDPARVAEFYASELPGWSQGEFYLNQAFWEGGDDYDPLDVSGQTTPSVLVMEPVGNRPALFPGTRSEIQVRYRP